MLKLNPNPTFSDEVEITVPGQREPGSINLTFKYRSRKEYSDLLAWLEDKTVSEALPEFVLGWDLPEEFNSENVAIFLNNYPAAYGEIFAAYSRLLFESRVKN